MGVWTITVGHILSIEAPDTYVVNAADEAAAVDKACAEFAETGDDSMPLSLEQLIIDIDDGPPADDVDYHCQDLRGIPAKRVVLQPDLIRRIARLRLEMKRREVFRAEIAHDEDRGEFISASRWEIYDDWAKDLVDDVDALFAALGYPAWNDGLQRRVDQLAIAADTDTAQEA